MKKIFKENIKKINLRKYNDNKIPNSSRKSEFVKSIINDGKNFSTKKSEDFMNDLKNSNIQIPVESKSEEKTKENEKKEKINPGSNKRFSNIIGMSIATIFASITMLGLAGTGYFIL
jgi:hypothetical protein